MSYVYVIEVKEPCHKAYTNSNFNFLHCDFRLCEDGKQIEIQNTTTKEPGVIQVMAKYLITKNAEGKMFIFVNL